MTTVSSGQAIGMVGVGRMGLSICARLVQQGFGVVATDVRPDARAAVVAAGGDWAGSVVQVAAHAEVVISVLPGPLEVCAICEQLPAALSSGSTWIDMSTATPAVAAEIARSAAVHHVRTLEAPVGGGPAEAREGQLLAFVGGSAEDLRAQRGVLDALTDRVLHVGAAGSGYAMKLLVNLLWFGQAIANAEVLSLAVRAGIDPETVRYAVQQSAAASRFMEQDAPALMRGENLTSFSLARCVEELSGVLNMGREHDVPLALGERVTEIYIEALKHFGDVDGELLAARRVTEQARIEFGTSGADPHSLATAPAVTPAPSV
ncbi:MAG: NAD(P)-dependent oxidoreductase [Actinomycetota bacterium]|nr:NAD(P)-dependent oxidoreductase [Actinomycetota bacterium]